jgi:HEAT repeat protein
MQEQDFEVSFCELCGTSVPAADVAAGDAVTQAGKIVGRCCLTALRGDAVPGPSAGAAVSSAGSSPVDSARLMTIAIVLLAALAGAVLFLDAHLARIEDAASGAHNMERASRKADSEALLGVAVKLDGAATAAELQQVRDAGDALSARLSAAEEAAQSRQAVLEQELDGLRRALRAAEDKIVDYRPLFEDLRQRHTRALAVIEGLRDRPGVAALEAPATPAAGPSDPQPPGPGDAAAAGLPAPLAEQVQKLGASDPAIRFEAVDALIESDNPDVLPHLLPLAKDADAFVRRLVVEGLRGFKKPEAVDALIEALRDADENVCDTAWRSLRDVTGQRLPFDASSTKEARGRAAQKWSDWWAKARDAFGR